MRRMQLKSYQYDIVDEENKLVLVKDTGEYCRQLNGEIFEVLYTLYHVDQPVIGKRADFIIMDDVETPKEPAFKNEWVSSVVKEYNKRTNVHAALLNEWQKPSGILNFTPKSSKTPSYKESEMEIGGHYCHLCGAEILQENRDTVYKKKQHLRVVNRYVCGTVVEKRFKSSGECTLMEDKGTKVILGDDCVEI